MINAHIVGVAKCGTTTLANYLSYHEDVMLAKGKEAHFFDIDDVYRKGPQFYHKIFGKLGKVNIDATPGYIRSDVYLRRLKQYYLDNGHRPRLIVMVRNPVDRAISHYLHRYRTGHETREFFEVVHEQMMKGPESGSDWNQYIADGQYRRIFGTLFDLFERSDVLVISDLELRHEAERCLSSVLDFLNLEDCADQILVMATGDKNVSSSPRSLLAARLIARESIIKNKLKSVLGRDKSRRLRFLLTNLNRSSKPLAIANVIKSDVRLGEIREYYEEDIRYVQEEFGKQIT